MFLCMCTAGAHAAKAASDFYESKGLFYRCVYNVVSTYLLKRFWFLK